MVYLFFVVLGIGLAAFVHYELGRLKAWASAEFVKLSATLKK
jgi:hypothetical protein